MSKPTDGVPGDRLLHPVVLAAIALLAVNDHVLKAVVDNWWTGKLSDFAGLVFFPVLLQAAWEWGRYALGHGVRRSDRVLLAAVIATGVVFSAAQLLPQADAAYRFALGLLQWPLHALAEGGAPLRPVEHVADAGDLIALPFLAVAWWAGRVNPA